ncbi:hypothetical protein C0991_000519 [Blastosporella zonata]|nr:hypothetical protein C0991_000519 [Blastosporella zonata]
MEMQEDGCTLEMILGLCYPISVQTLPHLTSLRDLRKAIRAAVKLEMEGVQKHLRNVLVELRFLESQPLQVFAITCRYGWVDEARQAARYFLRHPLDGTISDELELITAATYRRLIRYRKECGEAGASEILRHTVLPLPNSPLLWDSYEDQACPNNALTWMHSASDAVRERPWGQIVNNEDLQVGVKGLIVCDACARDISESLDDFRLVLSARIEKMITTVSPL